MKGSRFAVGVFFAGFILGVWFSKAVGSRYGRVKNCFGRLGEERHETYLLAVRMHQVLFEYGDASEQFRYRPDKGPWFLRGFLHCQGEWESAAQEFVGEMRLSQWSAMYDLQLSARRLSTVSGYFRCGYGRGGSRFVLSTSRKVSIEPKHFTRSRQTLRKIGFGEQLPF